MTTGQSVIKNQEVPTNFETGFLNRGVMAASTTRAVMFIADRDCWLNEVWFRSETAQSDGATFTVCKVADGTAVSGSYTALTDAIEIHSSGGWAASTKTDFTVLPTANYVAAGEVVFLLASESFQTSTPVVVGWRVSTRRM